MLHFLSDSCTSNSLPLEKGSIESCFESLSKSSLEPLMKTLGLPKSDSKVRVAETFVAFIAKHVPPTYRFVCCIDVGSRNLAWIIYDIERKCIVQWKKLDIKEKVTVAAYHSKLSKIVPKEMVLPCTSVKDYYFLIEKQHHASNQNKTIESLLFAAVGGSADEFEPRSVSSFRKEQLLLRWNTVTHMDKKFLKGRGDKGKASGNTHYFRKKEAVILVNCLLKEHALTFADDEVHLSYQNADKKDDLADVYIMLKFFLKRVSTVIEWYNRIQKDKTDGIN